MRTDLKQQQQDLESRIHLRLHKAGVELNNRPARMITELADLIAGLDLNEEGENPSLEQVKAIVNPYGIPQVPRVAIIKTLSRKETEP